MVYVIEPPKQTSVPVAGGGEFPVRRIYCVGQNYAAHAIEMGTDPKREKPVFFQKSPDTLVTGGGDFPYPTATSDVHHEVELVVALSGGGADIPVVAALERVYGYAVGIDFTRRNLQTVAKKAGQPWEAAKSFEQSAPITDIRPSATIGRPKAGEIWLDLNGARRQTGDIGELIWKVPEVIAELSKLFTLAPGDLIFTGTPSGVGPVARGDRVTCGVEGVGELSVNVI